MINIKRILPECCADTLLVSLVVGVEMLPDYNGIGAIANALKEFNDGGFVIGIIDTDKFKNPDPKYIRLFTEVIDDKLLDQGLIILKLPDSDKHIIRLHPAFETWILNAAKSCNIDPSDYGFNTLKTLISAAKKLEVIGNDNMRNFINAVISANPPAIQTLRYWLNKANTEY